MESGLSTRGQDGPSLSRADGSQRELITPPPLQEATAADMRVLVVLRHAMRQKHGNHLSQAGVSLARRVGEQMSAFDMVATSTARPPYETAMAMGFAVDEQLKELAPMEATILAEYDWPQPFAAAAPVLLGGGAVGAFARKQARVWRAIVERVPDAGAALLVTHGGVVEAGAVAATPEAAHAAWGEAIAYCEGVRLMFDDGAFRDVEMLRVFGHERVIDA